MKLCAEKELSIHSLLGKRKVVAIQNNFNLCIWLERMTLGGLLAARRKLSTKIT
jgi:hypothetical protein